MGEDLRVGIIGASATRGWARDSHVPAVQGLAGLRLGAVVGTDRGGGQSLRDFAHAVRLTRLTDDVLAAAADGGTRHAEGGWPDRA